MKAIQETAFKNDRIVICGKCFGHGIINAQPVYPPMGAGAIQQIEKCTFCNGAGTLHRVTEGTVKLFTVN